MASAVLSPLQGARGEGEIQSPTPTLDPTNWQKTQSREPRLAGGSCMPDH